MMKTLDLQARKSGLISGLRDVRKRILALASSLSLNEQDEIYLGTWSCRDMLAHLAGWDETNKRAASEILEGTLPSFYEHSGKDWAEYNAKLVGEYGRDDFHELLSLVRETHRSMLSFIEDIPASGIWEDRGIRAKGWKVTIGRLLEVEKQDEEEHYSQLKEFIEQAVKS
jgi:hypothetical protein